MALDDLYQSGIDAAIQNRAQLQPIAPTPEQGFSFWGVVTAPFKGVGSGSVESAAFWSEMAGAFGDVQASYNYSGMMPVGVQTESEWRPQDAKEARDRLMSGESFSNPVGDRLRETARWMGPDQQTAGAVEQTLFELSRVMTKAVGYSAVGGIVPGAVATGLDEGVRASDELRREGVDLGTRSKIGALTGVTTAVGVALPVAGTGLKSTAALVAAGGPGLFVAQNYLARDILETANYDKLADRYDPFDPVGLAVSTLLPAAFGGWALRGRAKAARAGEAGPVAEPWRNQPHNSELVDAARVQRAKELVDSWNLGKPGDIKAANDALLSVMRASDQLADGLPVNVVDSIPMQKSETAMALDRMIERAERVKTEMLEDVGLPAKGGEIAALRAEIESIRASRPVTNDAAVRARAVEIRNENPALTKRQAQEAARQEWEAQRLNADARIAELEGRIEADAEIVQTRRAVNLLSKQIEQMKQDRAAIDAPSAELTPLSAALRAAGLKDAPATPVRRSAEPTPETVPFQEGAPAPGPIADVSTAPARIPESTIQQASEQAIAARLFELQATRPDALVRLESLNDDLPLSEALIRIEAETQQAIKDADLLQVAANCAIGAK